MGPAPGLTRVPLEGAEPGHAALAARAGGTATAWWQPSASPPGPTSAPRTSGAAEQGHDPPQIIRGPRYLEDHEQAGVLDWSELEHLQVDPPGPRVINSDRRRPEIADGVLRPPFPEMEAGLAQLRHQRRVALIAGPLAGGGPELAEHRARSRLPPAMRARFSASLNIIHTRLRRVAGSSAGSPRTRSYGVFHTT